MAELADLPAGRQARSLIIRFVKGRMVELADTLALGANGEIRGGSSPLPPTIDIIKGCEGSSVGRAQPCQG